MAAPGVGQAEAILLLSHAGGSMDQTLTKPVSPAISLSDFRKRRKRLVNVNREALSNLSLSERMGCWITDRIGTMGFFLLIFVWTVLWLAWNLLVPRSLQFDPPTAFVFWLFISNLIQLLLMPLIMVGQNVQARHSELRADNDLDVNIKAEQEIEIILQHLEYQNALLIAMVEKLGICIQQSAVVASQEKH
jgi:uncharacterized membrane protein